MSGFEEIPTSGVEIGHNQTQVGKWMQELEPLQGVQKISQISPDKSPSFVKSVLLEVKGFLETRMANVDLSQSGEYRIALDFLGYIQAFNNLSFLEELELSPIDISKTQLIGQLKTIQERVDDVVYGEDFKIGGTFFP